MQALMRDVMRYAYQAGLNAWRKADRNRKVGLLVGGCLGVYFVFAVCAGESGISSLPRPSPTVRGITPVGVAVGVANAPTTTLTSASSATPRATDTLQPPTETPTATHTPTVTNTPRPTETPRPTDTPTNTPTPVPTATPKPTNTPTLPPPTATPIRLAGQGQQATKKVSLSDGLTIFRMTHNGSRNFAIWLLDEKGNKLDLLVNTIGAFNGAKALGIENAGGYVLDVTADGAWSVVMEQPIASPSLPKAPQSFSGRGQQVSALFILNTGLARFNMTHSGARNFAVWLLDQNGDKVALLVNTIGAFNGSKAVGVGYDAYVLDITADGSWTISVEQ